MLPRSLKKTTKYLVFPTIVFLGAGVTAGSSDEGVYTVDFAPTLAGLLGVPVPDDLDGLRIYP